jgi:hypothetical protein
VSEIETIREGIEFSWANRAALHAALDALKARLEAAEQVVQAARDYVGPGPTELVARRDAGDSLAGLMADPKWARLVEALARQPSQAGRG